MDLEYAIPVGVHSSVHIDEIFTPPEILNALRQTPKQFKVANSWDIYSCGVIAMQLFGLSSKFNHPFSNGNNFCER